MATIQFKAKPETIRAFDANGKLCEPAPVVFCPRLTSRHCDMASFRKHPRYGSFANSDLFKGMLARIRKEKFGDSGVVHLDNPPAGVVVDTSGFLAVVTVTV